MGQSQKSRTESRTKALLWPGLQKECPSSQEKMSLKKHIGLVQRTGLAITSVDTVDV